MYAHGDSDLVCRWQMILANFRLNKLCSRGAQICALPLFCDRDIEINPMTLKLKDDLDILKMHLQTENEVARSSHSQY